MRPLSLIAAALPLLFVPALRAQSAPTKPAPLAPAPGAEKAEEIGTIEGMELVRAGGGFLGVKTEGMTLKVTFYDAKKKKVAADAVRIAARWHARTARNMVLLPTGPDTLVSPPLLTRPFNYIIFLVLVGAEDKVIETFSINLNGTGA